MNILSTTDNILLDTPDFMPPPPPTLIDLPHNPDFSFMDKHSGMMLSRGYNVINQLEGWRTLTYFCGTSFIFSKRSDILRLTNAIHEDWDGHSGCSMGWVMRQLEQIAKNGFTNYKEDFCKKNRQ